MQAMGAMVADQDEMSLLGHQVRQSLISIARTAVLVVVVVGLLWLTFPAFAVALRFH
jgi:hypothetical protein